MDLVSNLALGFGVAFSAQNLLYALLGALLGTLIGVLPRIGAVAAIAMLLRLVYALDATPALIMLAALYCGAQYGASTAAILAKVPGESNAATSAVDGYQMARQGRAGLALAAAGLGSFFAGCVGTLFIAVCAAPLIVMAFQFGSAERASLMVLALIGAVVLTSGPLIKALCMLLVGMLLAQINTHAGVAPYSFDMPELSGGIGLVAIAMGLFAVGEIVANLEQPAERRELATQSVKGRWPTRHDVRDAWPAVARGTLLGSLLGLLPGGGALLASFASYGVEKHLAGPNSKLGKGDIRGVAGPESANNAGAQTAFIPMLILGVPANAVMALMLGALLIKGIPPGPQLMINDPPLFWGLIASLWVGNLMLVILNLPLVGIWIKLLTVPYQWVFPAITVFCCIGAYTLGSHGAFNVWLMALFALVGYVFYKLKCECGPLLLGFILGPLLEEELRHALLLSHGDWRVFVASPVSTGLLVTAALMLVLVLLPLIKGKREVAFAEAE